MLAQLIPQQGGPPITLFSAITIVGRSSKLCDLVIDHTSVSKQHCILVKTEGLILVRDLGSTNGTRVNGQRIRRAALLPNDNLAIANFKYQVMFGEEPEAKSAAKPVPETPIQRNALPDEYTS